MLRWQAAISRETPHFVKKHATKSWWPVQNPRTGLVEHVCICSTIGVGSSDLLDLASNHTCIELRSRSHVLAIVFGTSGFLEAVNGLVVMRGS